MPEREWLVAAIAAIFGLATIWAGLGNSGFAFQLWLPKLLDSKFGRGKARVGLVLLGLGLVLAGLFLASRAYGIGTFTPDARQTPGERPQ